MPVGLFLSLCLSFHSPHCSAGLLDARSDLLAWLRGTRSSSSSLTSALSLTFPQQLPHCLSLSLSPPLTITFTYNNLSPLCIFFLSASNSVLLSVIFLSSPPWSVLRATITTSTPLSLPEANILDNGFLASTLSRSTGCWRIVGLLWYPLAPCAFFFFPPSNLPFDR